MLDGHSDITLFTAPRAKPGIDLARTHQPDLILMDIHMPEMDGITAIKQLRNFEETRYIPVIAVSAYAMPTDIDKAIAEGFAAYITKPIKIDNFFTTIDKVLSKTFVSSDNT